MHRERERRERRGQDPPGGSHSREDICKVLSDLVGGLKAEEIEVPEQIVMRCEELQV